MVDAELVKDDEIVKDQILTDSDGFVPQHTKRSKKSEGASSGYHSGSRRTSKAKKVRLRAVNVSLRNVDGQSLFGNIVSQLENEKDAAALLRAALEGFPKTCLAAHVVGEPHVVQKDEQKATLRFQVQLKPNMAAYKDFRRLRKILQSEQKSRDRGEFAMHSDEETSGSPESAVFMTFLDAVQQMPICSRERLREDVFDNCRLGDTGHELDGCRLNTTDRETQRHPIRNRLLERHPDHVDEDCTHWSGVASPCWKRNDGITYVASLAAVFVAANDPLIQRYIDRSRHRGPNRPVGPWLRRRREHGCAFYAQDCAWIKSGDITLHPRRNQGNQRG